MVRFAGVDVSFFLRILPACPLNNLSAPKKIWVGVSFVSWAYLRYFALKTAYVRPSKS